MFRFLVCLSVCLLAVFITASALPQQDGIKEDSAASAWISDPLVGSNLLYIIPKDAIGSNTWGNLSLNGEPAAPGEVSADGNARTIFYIRDFKPAAGNDPFAAFVGEDWITVPVDENESLFRLIATHSSAKKGPLPKFEFDDKKYRLRRPCTLGRDGGRVKPMRHRSY